MLVTITTEAAQATDLGYLLHKNPANVFDRETSFGRALVFYPEASDQRCTAALVLDVDPVGLVRGKGTELDQYVNDRPYVASSLTSVVLGDVFRTAMSGRSKERPERVEEALPLRASLPAVRCAGGAEMLRRLFEPLGYTVEAAPIPVPTSTGERAESGVYSLAIAGTQTLHALLSHLYLLIPVADNSKHYYVSEDEIEKLVRRGEGWLASHPEVELITARYLAYRRPYIRAALEQLRDEAPPDEEADEAVEARAEEPTGLNDARLSAALAAVRHLEPPARKVIDLGCGEGRLLKLLRREQGIHEIVGADVSSAALTRAERALHLERQGEQERVRLLQGSLVYRDDRFAGFDVALLLEVIEHIDLPRLPALEQVVFGHARPRRVVVTTPNVGYNAFWPALADGRFRHRDHRFEWTREQFRAWAERAAAANDYTVAFQGVGPEHPVYGPPTQMALFDLRGGGR